MLSLIWVGLIQSIEGLNRAKTLAIPSKRECSWTGTLTLFCLWIQTDTLALLGSRICCPLDWNYAIGFPGDLAHPAGLRFVSLHNNRSHFCYGKSLPVSIQHVGSVFPGEHWLIHICVLKINNSPKVRGLTTPFVTVHPKFTWLNKFSG